MEPWALTRRTFLRMAAAGAGTIPLLRFTPRADAAAPSAPAPVYCCIWLEFIEPWEQNEALRQVKDLGLGNVVALTNTFHVGNSESARRRWKEAFPHLAEKVDAVPQFPARPEHGHAAVFDLTPEFRREQIKLCEELGLLSLEWPRELPPQERGPALFPALFMVENLSVLSTTRTIEQLEALAAKPVGREAVAPSIFKTGETLDFQKLHDWWIARFRAHAAASRQRRAGPLGVLESSAQIRLALEAGGDAPIFELVPSDPLQGLAATRGAARAYGKELWGLHAAMGYYRAPTDRWTPERLRIAYDLFYAGGASYFSEPDLALRNWGTCSGFFSVASSPPKRWEEQECRPFDDPICVRSREVLSSFYRFSQFHRRPSGGPRVRLGFLLGNLDGWSGDLHQERMWMVDDPGFFAAAALQTWRHFQRIFESESWYESPRKYYWQADPAKPLRRGTPPCGQVDLVPSEAPAEAVARYGTLVLLGWNTMTEELYTKLQAFVENGGTLLLSVPHLDTRTRTDRPRAFLRNGDVRSLCGVRITGPGEEDPRDVFLERPATNLRHVMPQGTVYLESAPLARLELHGAHPLAHPRKLPDTPVLLEHRVGRGTVYLLATWDYPGERLDSFLTDLLRVFAEAEEGSIAVEGRDVFYSVYDDTFPSGQAHAVVYLVNHDIYGQAAYPVLVSGNSRMPIRAGNELRVAWVIDELVIAPDSRFTQVTDARRDGAAWVVTLESVQARGVGAGEERRLQIETSVPLKSVTVDGAALPLQTGREGDRFVKAAWQGRAELRIE